MIFRDKTKKPAGNHLRRFCVDEFELRLPVPLTYLCRYEACFLVRCITFYKRVKNKQKKLRQRQSMFQEVLQKHWRAGRMPFNVPPHKRPRVDLQRLGAAANLFLSISDRLVRKRRRQDSNTEEHSLFLLWTNHASLPASCVAVTLADLSLFWLRAAHEPPPTKQDLRGDGGGSRPISTF